MSDSDAGSELGKGLGDAQGGGKEDNPRYLLVLPGSSGWEA